VWRQIAKELQKYNPNWIYTGSQCENKFKDIRKNYVKVKDHNVCVCANSTSGERKTCKFYEEWRKFLEISLALSLLPLPVLYVSDQPMIL